MGIVARLQVIKTSFVGGEISPFALGRVDLDRYHSCCESVQNYIPLIQGGAQRRPGTKYITAAMGPSRLIPFKFNINTAYVLEFGNQTLRFYKNGAQIQVGLYADWQANHVYQVGDRITPTTNNAGGYSFQLTGGGNNASGGSAPTWGQVPNQWTNDGSVPLVWYNIGQHNNPLQLTTPYNTATDSLWDIKFCQFADIMYLVHPSHPVQKLNRLGDTNWTLFAPTFYPPPTHEFDQDISGGTATLTPSAVSGLQQTFTASSAVFLEGDVGKQIVSGAGIAYITAIDGTNKIATADIIDNFASTAVIPAGSWKMRGSPGAWITEYGGVDGSGNLLAGRQLGVGQVITLKTYKAFPVAGSAPPSTMDCFRAADLGSYVVFGGAVAVITAVTNAFTLSARLLSLITVTYTSGSTNAPLMLPLSGGAWTVETPSFSAANGYPRACCFFQNRLCFAGTDAQPLNFWASVTDDFENFAKGPNDTDALDEGINSGDREAIQWLAAYQGQVAAGTLNGEYMLTGGAIAVGGNGPAITPSNFTASGQSKYGVAPIQPLFVENDLIYVQRSLITSFQFSYDIYRGVYGSKNLNLLSDIITTAGFKEMVYAQIPYRVLWFTDLAGNLVGLTYSREQDVWGWHRHFTGQDLATPDAWVSVCSIPDPSGLLDQVWFCTQRTVNNQTVYSIELMDPALYSDASTSVSGVGLTTISGLTYLRGRSVVINADGAALGPYVVPANGIVDFHLAMPSGAAKVQAGLPFNDEILTVRPEVQAGGGTVQAARKRWSRLWARVYNTVGLELNSQSQEGDRQAQLPPTRTPSNLMGTGVPPFTGDLDAINLGWDREGRVRISGNTPLPRTILALIGTLEVGDA